MRRLVLALALAAAAPARAAGPIEVEVAGVVVDPETHSPVVELAEKGGRRTLPIWVGIFEAQAIALELAGITPPRPMTHDLIAHMVEALGARLDRVEIASLEGHTYLAVVHLHSAAGQTLAVDARPSDAIAIAVRLHRPIVVPPDVFPDVQPIGDGVVRLYGLTVQELTPALAEASGVDGVHGALVSAVDARGPTRRVRRGDIITGVDGLPVASTAELVARLEGRAGHGEPPRLAVHRRGRDLTVRVRTSQPAPDGHMPPGAP